MKKNPILFAGSMGFAFVATRALLSRRKRPAGLPMLGAGWFHPGECVGGAD